MLKPSNYLLALLALASLQSCDASFASPAIPVRAPAPQAIIERIHLLTGGMTREQVLKVLGLRGFMLKKYQNPPTMVGDGNGVAVTSYMIPIVGNPRNSVTLTYDDSVSPGRLKHVDTVLYPDAPVSKLGMPHAVGVHSNSGNNLHYKWGVPARGPDPLPHFPLSIPINLYEQIPGHDITVSFDVGADGKPKNAKIGQTSNNAAVDALAIQAALKFNLPPRPNEPLERHFMFLFEVQRQ